ncbi:MAG: serine/threonine protein kinase, partial [Spirulina sp.]
MQDDVTVGIKFGRLALHLVSAQDAKIVKHQVLHVLALFVLHRQSPLKNMLSLSKEGYASALETGNLEYVGYNAHGFCVNSFWSGQPLHDIEPETRAYCQTLIQFNQLTTANWCRIYWQGNLNLLGRTKKPTILSGEALQEETFLGQLQAARDLTGLFFFYLYKLMLAYLFGDIESTREHSTEIEKYFLGGASVVGEPAFYFYDMLAVLARLRLGLEESSSAWEQVERHQKQLQHWADDAPMNHQHKVDLVKAEKCRSLGRKLEAIALYDKAIAAARDNEYIQEESLANELFAQFYLDWGRTKEAAIYMQEAYYCYARWGAKAKTDHLEKRYPQLLAPILQQQQLRGNANDTIATLTNGTVSS